MRFRFFLLLLSVLSCTLAFCLPYTALLQIPSADYVVPQYQLVAKQIRAVGTITQPCSKSIYLEAPVIAQEVLVSVGDTVHKDDVLVEIDTNLTRQVLAQGISVTKTQDPISALAAAAQKSGIPQQQLEKLLEQQQPEVSGVSAYETTAVPSAILSPMDGVITGVNIQSGVLSQSTQPVLTIGDDRFYQVEIEIAEEAIAQVRVGHPADITGAGFPDRHYEGIVNGIYPTAQPGEQQANLGKTVVRATVDILEPDEHLKSGFSAQVTIQTAPEEKILTLPYQAILQDEYNREYVYLYRDGKVQRQTITVGQELTWVAEITSGLQESDVVLLPEPDLKEGQNIFLNGRASLAA